MIDKGQWWEFGQDTGVTPLLFTRSAMGFFNDHRESGPRFNVSTERRYNTLPVFLLGHKSVTSLRPNHWRYQKSLCNLTSSVSWDHADQLWWWSDEDSRTSTWNCTECVFQTIQHGRLSCWAEQIDSQHESCLADEIYRCMNFGDCRWNGVCHRAPYKRV